MVQSHPGLHMKIINRFDVLEQDTNGRLDIFLSEKLSISRSQAKKMVDQDHVLVNEKKPKKAGDKLHVGDKVGIIELTNSPTDQSAGEKDKELGDYDIDVVEETADYIVINKPAGLLVHPTEANEVATLTNWLLEKYPEIHTFGDNPEQ